MCVYMSGGQPGCHVTHVRRRIHACHMRRRIHACHMRRRIHEWRTARVPAVGVHR
jgi:hypothetical protein